MKDRIQQTSVTAAKRKPKVAKTRSNTNEKSTPKDRAEYRCPEPLKRLIDLVNSIPPEIALPHYREKFEEGMDMDQFEQFAIEKLSGVPEEFIGHSASVAYDQFRSLRKAVHELAQIARWPPIARALFRQEFFDGGELFGDYQNRYCPNAWREVSVFDKKHEWSFWEWPKPESAIQIDETTGKFIEAKDKWLNALIGPVAERLRECKVCQRIFWAKRKEAWACPLPYSCGARLRQQRRRQKEPESEAIRAEKERRLAMREKRRK